MGELGQNLSFPSLVINILSNSPVYNFLDLSFHVIYPSFSHKSNFRNFSFYFKITFHVIWPTNAYSCNTPPPLPYASHAPMQCRHFYRARFISFSKEREKKLRNGPRIILKIKNVIHDNVLCSTYIRVYAHVYCTITCTYSQSQHI